MVAPVEAFCNCDLCSARKHKPQLHQKGCSSWMPLSRHLVSLRQCLHTRAAADHVTVVSTSSNKEDPLSSLLHLTPEVSGTHTQLHPPQILNTSYTQCREQLCMVQESLLARNRYGYSEVCRHTFDRSSLC